MEVGVYFDRHNPMKYSMQQTLYILSSPYLQTYIFHLVLMADQERKKCYFQKQPLRGVLKKRFSENLTV